MTLQSTQEAPPTRSLQIGLVAYAALPSLVFVRVPNERGRWILTDRCVVEVDCPICKAIAGEPCKRWASKWAPPPFLKYHAGTHAHRRDAARQKRGRSHHAGDDKPKLRIPVDDLEAAQSVILDGEE